MLKIQNLIAILLIIIGSSYAIAENTASKQTVPTESSQPLPKLEKVKNVDTVLSERVQSVITKTDSLKGQSVSAASRDQIITLEGSVETKAQEDAAIKAAQSVPCVKDVKSQLTIKGKQ